MDKKNNTDEIELAITGIITNIGVMFLMSLIIMLMWNWLVPVEYEFTYLKTVGSLYLIKWIYGSITYNYFESKKYKEKKENIQ